MSDLERLKKLDPQEVYKRTYISPKVLQSLIEGDFTKLGNRAKALGFIAILEREFDFDLHELRDEIDRFFANTQPQPVFDEERIEKTKRSRTVLIVAIMLFIGVGGFFFYVVFKEPQNVTPLPKPPVAEVNKTTIVATQSCAKENTTQQKEENKSSKKEENRTEQKLFAEENLSFVPETNESNRTYEDEEDLPDTVTIVPKKKLWVGVLYLDNYKRKNYVTTKPIEINTSRDQLIITGHGLFKIEHNGAIEDFTARGKQRFIYRAGVLEKIDKETFKRYNRGRDW